MIVDFTDEAEHDLETIGDYIARDNPGRALSFVRELRGKCLGLADMPKRFPLVPRYEAAGVRRRGHGDYLIFYRVEPDKVVIVHILHGAQDYASILFPA
ncbi:type II toxin-antitoxin system RelE/ParE family toxin [Stakelama pacifica]|uniref:Plasmid stabilization system protein ParE n=1 Tax=Stakelama pacifica TaxID=517720 RepID=A0A4R6FGN9_9SPHN|nr:type II toxin-antitoxin system RelE/ParE family toxin [Stakelama pacifica]MAM74737.1 plasmid stabilization protein [Tistrella sp.]TDN79595.1 plasmid stabilization system protein ParE [Stakelama pacifica]GGP00086.1 plasmid stabilization protein [Stakelama pacifica]|tara:strand:+ start:170 stop:466 length:297 start_codon:yes stop_codon:yes gene_type:complete